jgi:D-alanyl-D-alanine dipeptidase
MKFISALLIILVSVFVSDIENERFSRDISTAYNDSLWAEVNFKTSGMINSMAYADTANFMHAKIYPCARCFLRPEVALALEKANSLAETKKLRLVIYDCYRPYGFQKKMYDIVNNPRYVAKPGKGSNHNRGAAVDLALADENGQLLDMGNAFDDFSELSHYTADGITTEAKKNRKILRSIMVKAGFKPYDNEWWHFDYKQNIYPVSGFIWKCE